MVAIPSGSGGSGVRPWCMRTRRGQSPAATPPMSRNVQTGGHAADCSRPAAAVQTRDGREAGTATFTRQASFEKASFRVTRSREHPCSALPPLPRGGGTSWWLASSAPNHGGSTRTAHCVSCFTVTAAPAFDHRLETKDVTIRRDDRGQKGTKDEKASWVAWGHAWATQAHQLGFWPHFDRGRRRTHSCLQPPPPHPQTSAAAGGDALSVPHIPSPHGEDTTSRRGS